VRDDEIAAEVAARPGPNVAMVVRYYRVAAPYLTEGERLLNAGIAQGVQVAERVGRGSGEGTLLISDRHVLRVLDEGAELDVAVPIADITDVQRESIAFAGMSELTIAGRTDKGDQRVSFYAGTTFCIEVVRLLNSCSGGPRRRGGPLRPVLAPTCC